MKVKSMSRMIYHVPYPLNPKAVTGSGVRPVRMYNAFRSLGYDVELVAGTSSERSRIIRALRKRIKDGEEFSFVYSESNTMPTALTDPDHLPRHPFMDLLFLRMCRKNGIKVGLFYRDIFWCFPEYRARLNAFVHTATRLLYHFDLLGYRLAVDKLYMPSLAMGKFVAHVPASRHAALPPGGELIDLPRNNTTSAQLELFYVGGMGGYNDMHECVRAVNASKSARLTICCPEKEWLEHGDSYEGMMGDRITLIHKTGADLQEYYEKADICMLFIEPSIYRTFAVPIKFFEYIGFGKPVIVNENTNIDESVSERGNGWVIPFESSELTRLLDVLSEDPELVRQATDKTIALREENTWMARARQVAGDLTRS